LSEIDRAVWSFWSAPMAAGSGSGGWLESKYHLMSWVFSVEMARRHFRKIALVTDTPGADLLVDGLGLRFDEVSTELDALTADATSPAPSASTKANHAPNSLINHSLPDYAMTLRYGVWWAEGWKFTGALTGSDAGTVLGGAFAIRP
jgi:hypothetical protein